MPNSGVGCNFERTQPRCLGAQTTARWVQGVWTGSAGLETNSSIEFSLLQDKRGKQTGLFLPRTTMASPVFSAAMFLVTVILEYPHSSHKLSIFGSIAPSSIVWHVDTRRYPVSQHIHSQTILR